MAGVKGQQTGKRLAVPERYDERFLSRLDGRYKIARELKERLTSLEVDLGGKDNLSHQKQSLCKRAIYMEAIAESIEIQLAEGKTIAINEYVQVTDCLNRLYKALGLSRHSKELRLQDYIKEKYETDTD